MTQTANRPGASDSGPATDRPTIDTSTQNTAEGASTAAEFVSGHHLAEVLGVKASADIVETLGPEIARGIIRWHHREVDEVHESENLEDLLAVPVECVQAVVAGVLTRADVAAWASDTGERDPHAIVAERRAETEARRRLNTDYSPMADRTAPKPTTGLRGVLDEHADVFDSSPELTAIHQFARARGAGAWATLGGALVRAVLGVPHRVTLPPIIGGPVSLNLLLAVAGVSGGGKDLSDAAASAVIDARVSGAPTHWDPFPVGTGEGLNRTFAAAHKDTETGRAKTEFHCRSALFTVRDIGAFDALADRRGQTLVTELLKAAMGQEIGFTNATIEHRVILPAHSYRLGLTAGVQPGNGSSLLGEKAVRDGLTQRFLWFPVREGRRRPPVDEPQPISLDIPQFGVTVDPLDPDDVDRPLVHMDVAEQIRREIIAVNDAKDEDVFGRTSDPLAGHRLLARLKAAAALAVLHRRTSVDLEDWQRAGSIVAVSEAVVAEVAAASGDAAAADAAAQGRLDGHRSAAADATRTSVADQELAEKFLGILADRGDEWTPHRSLVSGVTSSRRRSIEPALCLLAERGQIERRRYEYQKGRTRDEFRATR